MDETALNFRTLPKASLGTASGKGYVAAKDRLRLTAVLWVNATGKQKIKPMIIGSAAKPHCFSSWEPERETGKFYTQATKLL
jgi:hypothetical protein